MTVTDAHQAIDQGRHDFGFGNWSDAYRVLHPLHESQAVEGTQLGEVAFYLGVCCARLGDVAAAGPYLEEATRIADVDFAAWAQEELNALAPGGGDAADEPNIGDRTPQVIADGELHHVQQLFAAGNWQGIYDYLMSDRGTDFFDSTYPGVPAYYLGEACLQLNSIDWAIHYLQEAIAQADAQTAAAAQDALARAQASQAGGPADQSTPAAATGAPAPAAGAGGSNDGEPDGAEPVVLPEDQVGGSAQPAQPFKPLTPDLSGEEKGPDTWPVGASGELKVSWKIPINKGLGPVMVKEIPVEFAGKLSSPKGEWSSLSVTPKNVKINSPSWSPKFLDGEAWDAKLKGSLSIGGELEGGVGAKLEITYHGKTYFEVDVTLVKYENDDWGVAEVTPTGVLPVEETFEISGETFELSGEASIGLTCGPNWTWILGEGAKAVAEVAVTEGAATGVAAVGSAELLIATGFVAIAASTLYVGYRNITDMEALEQIREDAPKAASDFANGFVAGYSGGSAPGGFWGSTGSTAGSNQLDADARQWKAAKEAAGEEVSQQRLEAAREGAQELAAGKAEVFRAVALAMFGPMVRTAIAQAFLKAHPTSTLAGDHVRDVYDAVDLEGPSAEPNVGAALAAAETTDDQINAAYWAKTFDDQPPL